MSVWSWLKLTVCRWLIRKAAKGAGWLAIAALAVAIWPVTLIAACGYLAAWLRGWPPVRLYRAAAWALPVTAAWLAAAGVRAARIHAAAGVRTGRWPGALWPGRAAVHGWDHLAAADQARVVALAAPAAVPAGLALAGLAWAWRRYAVSAGLGGMMASAPITFDTRQWKRQVRTAKGLIKAPGAVPLLARDGKIPVGGTIRAAGHRWHPVLSLPSAACGRHMVIVGSTGSGKTNLALSEMDARVPERLILLARISLARTRGSMPRASGARTRTAGTPRLPEAGATRTGAMNDRAGRKPT